MLRHKVRQHPERAVPEEASEILSLGHVAHVGYVEDGQPYVIPFSYHYDPAMPDALYLHGAHSSRTLSALSSGGPVCVSITEVDGLVYSRQAMSHSMNYRSVVCFGSCSVVEDVQEMRALFESMTLRYFPGRTAGKDYNVAPDAHLKATTLLKVTIDELSAKARRGGPKGPEDADENAGGTAGVIELRPPACPRQA